MLQCIAMWCSVFQCVAVCCSVLRGRLEILIKEMLAVGVLQCDAVCCSVLQCVAVCCSVLQCVEVCYAGSTNSKGTLAVWCVAVCLTVTPPL